jgi:UDP-glucose 4-epimerase
MVERVLEDYSKAYDLQYAALRYFNVIGNDPELRIGEAHSPETHLLPCVIQAALGQRPKLEVFGNDYPTPDGTAVRDYVHVLDLARGHVEALQWLRTHPGETLQVNFGTETGHSVLEIIRTTERVLDKPVPYILSARREGDPPSLVASSEQVRILLGWRPNYSLHESIEHVTQWFRKEGKF